MLAVAAAVVVGAAFVLAGAAKIVMGRAWPAQAAGLGVPRSIAVVVPWWELLVGALLIVQFQRQVVAWVAVATLVAFTALIAVRLSRGQRPPCACFGAWTARPIGAGTVARNAGLIAVAVVAAVA